MSSTRPTAPTRITREAAHVADHLLLQRHDAERQAAVGRIDVGMIAPEPRGERVHLRLRLGQDDAALQLAEDVVVLAPADRRRLRPERKRQQDLRVLGGTPSVGITSRGREKDSGSTPTT